MEWNGHSTNSKNILIKYKKKYSMTKLFMNEWNVFHSTFLLYAIPIFPYILVPLISNQFISYRLSCLFK